MTNATQEETKLGAYVAPSDLMNLLTNVATHADTRRDAIPALNSIRLWADSGYLFAAATDRYRLIEGRITLEEGRELAPILVSVADSKRLCAMMKENPIGRVELHVIGDLLSVSVSGGAAATVRGVYGTFPPYSHVFDNGTPTPTDKLTLNPRFIADYAKIAGKDKPISLVSLGEGKPIAIEGLPEGYAARVMPMKIR